MPATDLGPGRSGPPATPVIGVFAPGDPRLDKATRQRCRNILPLAANRLSGAVKTPDGKAVKVVYTTVLVDGEATADIVARQFKEAGVGILVALPDTWAFPQPSLMNLFSQFPSTTPINITCGNAGPKPGVVYAQALVGALAQSGRLATLNVGTWPDTGAHPEMTDATFDALVDWCYAALAAEGLRGRRVVMFGHDSMGMETALTHVVDTRRAFGLEITRLDMKLLVDLLAKGAAPKKQVNELVGWFKKMCGPRLAIKTKAQQENFATSCAMYLIVDQLLKDLNAAGGGFMNQLEWGSDRRGVPLPGPDQMESLFNSGFDHRGKKTPMPFATETDMQGLLTQLYFTWLSGGNPPLFMDFRKVWEPWEAQKAADELGVAYTEKDVWAMRGFVDGNNSGSAAFDWAGKPGWKSADVMARVGMPNVDPLYFPGGGNSVTFVTPGGISGIAGRMAFSTLTQQFSLVWDEAVTLDLPAKMEERVRKCTDYNWPHTWVSPMHATMAEYKQYAPANHFHMTWGLNARRLEYWMDLSNVLSLTPWAARPGFTEGVDRPTPLVHLLNGGEAAAKRLLRG